MSHASDSSPTVVIGSNCFTGSHIVEALLQSGRRVVGISRSPEYKPLYLPYAGKPGFEFRQLDFVREFPRLANLLDELAPKQIVHVAALSEVALSNEKPLDYFETNVTALVKLGDHLRRQKYLEHYVHISSAEIFGPCQGAVDETRLFNPTTPYAVSKAAGDLFLSTLAKNFGFPLTLIRSTNVYGKHQQLFKIIPRTAIYLKMGRKIELHGGGTSVKSFIHIRDVVDGLMLTMQKRALGTYHFSVASDRTVAQVVELVCRQMGYDFVQATQIVGERLGQDSRYWLDTGKAQRELGWQAKVDFAQGVQETIDWVQANWPVIQQEPLNYIHRFGGEAK